MVGVADANAARNNIAKDYMKKCNCIWILAPITRAVDDKTARGSTVQRPTLTKVCSCHLVIRPSWGRIQDATNECVKF